MKVCLIISLGSIGKRHLKNLRKIDEHMKIVVLRRNASSKHTEEDSIVEVNTMRDALSYSPAMAIVASPAVFHVQQCLTLLQKGVHLFIEKPVSHNLARLDKLRDISEERSLVVMVGYVLRFSPVLKQVKSILESGMLGDIINISAHCGQYLPDWRPGVDYRYTVSAREELGGGASLELSHEFDYLYWLFGRIDKVNARTASTRILEINVEDKVDAILKFDQGFFGTVHLNFLEKRANRELRISGTNGSISCDLIERHIHIRTADRTNFLDLSKEKVDIYLDELSEFLNCTKSGRKPSVTLDDGIQAVKVVEAIKESSSTGQWVKV